MAAPVVERPCKVVQALRDFSFPPPFKEIRDFVTVTAPSKKKKSLRELRACRLKLASFSPSFPSPPEIEAFWHDRGKSPV